MHRFFLSDQTLAVGALVDLKPLAQQLVTVLRLRPGTQVGLLDGNGSCFVTELVSVTRQDVQGHIVAQEHMTTEPATPLTLYQCALKTDKFEWVLQKGTELGVSRFVPVISERTIVRPAAALLKRYGRWQAILKEAAEQSGRGRIPQLAEPQSWTAAVQAATGRRYVPWEGAQNTSPGLGTLLQPGSNEPISLAIGPEGGLSTAEVAVASEAGWQAVSLGPRILRAETAALAGITIIFERLGDLSGAQAS